MNKILKVGHRGACGYEPENTLLSFQKAIDIGVDMIELDVHLSKDDQVIVMHDESIDRTTNGQGKIIEKYIDEIQKVNINNNQSIPTLEEVVKLINKKCAINIEIKNKKAAKQVLKVWNNNNLSSNSLISSNHVSALKFIKQEQPEIQTALIYYATKTDIRQYIFTILSWISWPITKFIILKRANIAKVDWINLAKEFAFKKFIKSLQNKNYKIGVWVVNKKRHIKKFSKYNVDAIISDYPDRL